MIVINSPGYTLRVAGYNIEGWIRKRGTPPANASIQDKRIERHLEANEGTSPLRKYNTIFDKESNISPSLKK